MAFFSVKHLLGFYKSFTIFQGSDNVGSDSMWCFSAFLGRDKPLEVPTLPFLLMSSRLIYDSSITLIQNLTRSLLKKNGITHLYLPISIIRQVNRTKKKTHDHLKRCRKKDLMKFDTHYDKSSQQMRRKLSKPDKGHLQKAYS